MGANSGKESGIETHQSKISVQEGVFIAQINAFRARMDEFRTEKDKYKGDREALQKLSATALKAHTDALEQHLNALEIIRQQFDATKAETTAIEDEALNSDPQLTGTAAESKYLYTHMNGYLLSKFVNPINKLHDKADDKAKVIAASEVRRQNAHGKKGGPVRWRLSKIIDMVSRTILVEKANQLKMEFGVVSTTIAELKKLISPSKTKASMFGSPVTDKTKPKAGAAASATADDKRRDISISINLSSMGSMSGVADLEDGDSKAASAAGSVSDLKGFGVDDDDEDTADAAAAGATMRMGKQS